MPKNLHPRDDSDILHVPRTEGRRGLVSIEDSVDLSIHRLKDYIKKSRERLIIATRNYINSTRINGITRKQKWDEKQL